MDIQYAYTKRQVPRGTRADAESPQAYYLIKNLKSLQATYQVRLLAYLAQKNGKKLIIRAPKVFRPAGSLQKLMAELKGRIVLELV